MTMSRLPRLTPQQAALLQRVYSEFRRSGEWPQFGQLDRSFDDVGVDLTQVLSSVPVTYVRVDRFRIMDPPPEMQIALTVLGIAQCEGSDADVDVFLRLLRWLAERERIFDPAVAGSHEVIVTRGEFIESQVTDVSGGWTDSPSELTRVGKMLAAEPPGVWRSFSDGPDGWTVSLSREVRRYRDVQTIDDYLAVIVDIAPGLFGLATETALPEEVTTASSNRTIGGSATAATPLVRRERVVFLVHGHNHQIRLEVAKFLEMVLGKRPVILHEQADKGRTIIEKFEDHAGAANFAVILLTGDDEGRVGGDGPWKARARQNVVLEHGFFIGRLGREQVVALYEEGVELPSDLSGVLYKPLAGNWQAELVLELEAAGFEVSYDGGRPPGSRQLINMEKFFQYRQATKPAE